MCGRHSKGQCAPAENGHVERVTEVAGRPSRTPIPSLCVGRGDPCGASLVQYNPYTLQLGTLVGTISNSGGGRVLGFGIGWEWRDAGVVGISVSDRRISRVLAGGQMPDGFWFVAV